MASIANATVVYVAVGGGGTPLEIYNKQNQWMTVNGYNGDIFLFHDNGDGTMNIVGSGGSTAYLNLPSGYVFNGNGAFKAFGQYYSYQDGSNSRYVGIGFSHTDINTTINVRKTN